MASFKNVFCQFLSTVNQHIANVELRLKSGAIDEQISKFQDSVGKKLPKDFVELYRLHDGEMTAKGPQLMAGLRFLTLGDVQGLYEAYMELDKEFNPVDTLRISNKSTSKTKWIPFASDDDECFFAVDLTPTKEGKVGQIIAVVDKADGQFVYLMADSLSEFIEKMINWLNDGSLVVVKEADSPYISEEDGHFFNSIRKYAVVPAVEVPDKTIELKDEFWQTWYQTSSISAKTLAKFDEDLYISRKDISCEPLAYIGNLKKLQILGGSIRDFHCLGQNPNIIFLKLWATTFDDGDLSVLKGCANLKELTLFVQSLKGIDKIGTLPNLEIFNFVGTLTPEVKSFIKSSSKLIGFRYDGVLDDSALDTILSIPNLEVLSLKGELPNDLSFVTKLSKIKELEIISNTETSIENLDFLLELKNLNSFKMNTLIKDERSISEVLNLKKLKTFSCPVSNIDVYRNNTKLKEVGILGQENLDLSLLEGVKGIKSIVAYCTDEFKTGNGFKLLARNVRSLRCDFDYRLLTKCSIWY